jgi:NodT family efflux transporter outer membrane factor (OMF) lipoprotein
MNRRVWAGLILPLALVACVKAGPDYHLPAQSIAAVPAAGQSFVGAKGQGVSDQPLPAKWWRVYNDSRLDALVEQAIAANADLRAADANLRRASALVQQSRAGRLLSTGVSADVDLARPSKTGYDLPGILGYDGAISASLPLDFSGKIARAIEAAQADEDTVRAARDTVRVTVAAAVTRAYASICAANESYAANQHVLDLQQRTLEATQRLQRGGRGTSFDISRARTAVDQSAATLPVFVAQRQANLFLIATLMGRVPADYPTDIATCPAIPALSSPLPVGDGAALIRRRPDIRAAERTLAADTARVGVATADLYPQVSLGGSLGLGGPVGSFGDGNSFGFSLGPLLSWSFPNRPVVKAQIAAAGAKAEADLAQFDSVVLGALRQTETALSAYTQDRARIAALTGARDSAAQAGDQADRLFRFGRTDFLQLLDAQRSLASAQSTLAAGQTSLINDQIDIFLALGGGWEG